MVLVCVAMGCHRVRHTPQCVPKDIVRIHEVEIPYDSALSFRASTGENQYENASYSQLENADGPLELYNTLVTNYVMTDQNLAADCSDIGGVDVRGKAWIHQTTLRNPSYFHDHARFYESRAQSNLSICGNLEACDSHFGGNLDVGGEVTLTRSTLAGTLTAKAEMVDLQASSAQQIVVEATGPYYDHQVVRLAHGSSVSGDIVFKSGHGRVCIDQTSSFGGKIEGGHVIPPHYWQEH